MKTRKLLTMVSALSFCLVLFFGMGGSALGQEEYIYVSCMGNLEFFNAHKFGWKWGGERLAVKTTYVGPAEYDLNAMVAAKEIFIPDTETQTEWYFVLKAGCWNDLNAPTFIFLFDEIYLTDLGVAGTTFPIENIVFGTVDNAEDFTGTVNMSWDADSVYLKFIMVDDSIVNAGASYQVDNIEIYFDMDNSKNDKPSTTSLFNIN